MRLLLRVTGARRRSCRSKDVSRPCAGRVQVIRRRRGARGVRFDLYAGAALASSTIKGQSGESFSAGRLGARKRLTRDEREELHVRRVCFTLQVKPDRLDEYRERHAAVWPDMLQALAATGWRNYSLFLRPDGLLVGYLECDNFETSQETLAQTAASRRWEESMADFFVDVTADDKRPLDEVFHLEEQLAEMQTEAPDRRMGEAR